MDEFKKLFSEKKLEKDSFSKEEVSELLSSQKEEAIKNFDKYAKERNDKKNLEWTEKLKESTGYSNLEDLQKFVKDSKNEKQDNDLKSHFLKFGGEEESFEDFKKLVDTADLEKSTKEIFQKHPSFKIGFQKPDEEKSTKSDLKDTIRF